MYGFRCLNFFFIEKSVAWESEKSKKSDKIYSWKRKIFSQNQSRLWKQKDKTDWVIYVEHGMKASKEAKQNDTFVGDTTE